MISICALNENKQHLRNCDLILQKAWFVAAAIKFKTKIFYKKSVYLGFNTRTNSQGTIQNIAAVFEIVRDKIVFASSDGSNVQQYVHCFYAYLSTILSLLKCKCCLLQSRAKYFWQRWLKMWENITESSHRNDKPRKICV